MMNMRGYGRKRYIKIRSTTLCGAKCTVIKAGGTYSYQVLSLVYIVRGPRNELGAEVAVEMFSVNFTEEPLLRSC